MRQTTILLAILALFLFGCSPSLKLLMQIDKEDKAIKRQLRLQEARFDLLVKDLDRNRIKKGSSKRDIIARYGEPISELAGDNQGQLRRLLYRYPLQYFNATKVYLYFDNTDILVRWDVIARDEDE